MEKTFWGTTRIEFLGLLIDTILQIICIPVEKILKGHQLITNALHRKRNITLENLQKITGFLNFLGKAVVPGRAFTRRLYSYENKVLKPHHHIDMDAEMKDDLRTWLEFLSHPGIFSRGFADFDLNLTSVDIDMYTDATANETLGCGGYSETNWFILQWDEKFIINFRPSINYLELYAVTIAIFNWINKYQNKRITLFCDNMSVVHMINNSSSNCKNCMVLLRLIILKGMINNVKITAKHVAGKLNKFSDLLSRMKYGEFRKQARLERKQFDKLPTKVPEELWPMSKLWKQIEHKKPKGNKKNKNKIKPNKFSCRKETKETQI